jgi:hypothetical protein
MESDESPYTREELRKWMSIPAKQKLEWLEEANNFVDKFLTVRKREMAERQRRGELRQQANEDNSHSD